MTTRYPGAIDGYSQIRQARNRIDEIVAEDHNDLRSAILAIENALGINPQGSSSVADRLDDQASDFDDHVDGVGFRHVDTHIDAGAKAGTYNNLGAGTTTTQIQGLLDLFDYAGSGASKFADGVGLSAQNFKSTPADIVSKLGSTSGDDKVGAAAQVGSPTSLPSGSVRDHTSALLTALNSNTNEVRTARQSDIFGNFPTLDNRLEALDAYISAVVTCTDGINSTGGMYNGQDALQRAIHANGDGAIVLLQEGEYHITNGLSITNTTHIIGSGNVVIANEVQNANMMTFEPDAYGSSIQSVSIINYGNGTYQAIENHADNFIISRCKVEGSIEFLTGEGARIDQCYIYPYDRNCITITSISTRISQSVITIINSDPLLDGYEMLDFRGQGCYVHQCTFLDNDGNYLIVDSPNSGRLVIKDCDMRCAPFKRNTQAILLSGRRPEIDGLRMYVWGNGFICTSMLCVNEATTFRGRNIRINMRENLIGDISVGGLGPNNPVAIYCTDAVIDGFIMDGGMIPRTADVPGVLDNNYPIIQLTGRPNYDLVGRPTQITKGRVKLCNATISAPYFSPELGQMNVVLIGDQGQDGYGTALHQNGFFELENVNIDGYRCEKWDLTDFDDKHMVSNIQHGSKIHGCSFTNGETSGWNTIINCVDAYDVQVLDNSFLLTGFKKCANIILGLTRISGVWRMMINDNNIVFNDLDTNGAFQGAITLLVGRNCSVCNNVIYNTDNVGSGIYLINLFVGTANCVVTGNTIHTGDGGAANIPIYDLSWAGPPGFPNPPPENLWSHWYSLVLDAFIPIPPPPLSLGPIAFDLNIVS